MEKLNKSDLFSLEEYSINRDSFNQLYSQTRSYVIQPRYTVFRLKYDLTSFAGGSGKSKGGKTKGGKK